MTRRTVPLVPALALLAGCGATSSSAAESTTSAAPSASVTAGPSATPHTPREELTGALKLLDKTPHSFAVAGTTSKKQKIRATGAHDPAARKLSRTVTTTRGQDAKVRKLIVIGDDSYRSQPGNQPWIHADLSRLKRSSAFSDAGPKDPTGLRRFASALTDVRSTSPHAFKGTAWVAPAEVSCLLAHRA